MFVTRLISGIVLLLIAFVGFFYGAPVLTLLLFLISLAGYRELVKALGTKEAGRSKYSLPELAGYASVFLYYGCLLLDHLGILDDGKNLALPAVTVFFFLTELFIYVLTFPRYQAEQIAYSVFAFFYAPVMLSFIDMTRAGENGKVTVWIILISSWGCDTCAYCVGKLIGKKKVFPLLSPKKSLEGCVGGVLGAALLGAVYGWLTIGDTPQRMIIFAVICAAGAIMSMAGDLAASAIKRNKGIKDYGKLIPGHGGIMDRFDSVIVTAPMVYFLAEFFLHV